MGLRTKILSGFLILATMLLIAGVWSVRELDEIGSSVQLLLDENYRSIDAARTMLEALERQDSGILLLLLGRWEEGRAIINAADSSFTIGLDLARSNITMEGEQTQLDTIETRYGVYKRLWRRPIVDTQRQGNINWYFERVHRRFLEVKRAVNDLMIANDRAMFETASQLESKASRAVMPGVVAILAALLFSLIFSYFVNYYVVRPIVWITNSVKDFVDRRQPFDVAIETEDEFSELANSIATLCALVKPPESEL